MKLEKAIEIQENYLKGNLRHCYPERYDALNLLIEAGKRLQDRRLNWGGIDNTLLPGETTEEERR